MIKKLLIVLICAVSLHTNAQDKSASPYSFYGIGTLKFKGTVENRSMGGLSIFTDSIHVNLRNPTSYVSPNLKVWKEESRPVKFSVGGSNTSLNLKGQESSSKANTTTLNYVAFSFPIGRFGAGFGLLPYTAVGYKLESDLNDDGKVDNRYQGDGGLNKAFLGVGYMITDELSIGVDVSYNFGNTQNTAIAFLYDDEGRPYQYQTFQSDRSDLSGINTNFGISYKKMVSEKLQLTSSLIYAPKSTLTSNNNRTFSTVVIDPSTGNPFLNSNTGEPITFNTIDGNLEEQNLKSTDLSLPSRLAFGAGLGQPRKWFVGAEYTRQNTSEFSNPFVAIDDANFVNASGIAIGGFFIPDYNSFSSYWKRVTYRSGVHFEGSGLTIKGEDITEFGMSFGVGLPVGGWFSNANIGLEFGKRGTTNQNLIQENFVNLQISLSLNARWFEKLKYK